MMPDCGVHCLAGRSMVFFLVTVHSISIPSPSGQLGRSFFDYFGYNQFIEIREN